MWNTSVSCTKETKKLQLGWVELLVFILKPGTCSPSSALNFLIGVTTPCSLWRASSWDGFLQQQPSPARFQPVGTAEVGPSFPWNDLVAEGRSGQSKGQHPQSPWRRASLQKESLGSPIPVFILHVVASCMCCPQWKRCKRRAECKLMGQSDFMCGQIHFGKSKQVRKVESCLFNGEHIHLKSTICGWWCNRRAVYVSVCEALH